MCPLDPQLLAVQLLPAATPRWVEAAFHVGVQSATYRTCGSGRLVLALTHRADAAFEAHCARLAATARVVMPALGQLRPARAPGLVGLLDVFGADEATLVADATATLDALALAIAWPERVAAVTLVGASAETGDAAQALLLPAIGRRLVPVAVERYIDVQ